MRIKVPGNNYNEFSFEVEDGNAYLFFKNENGNNAMIVIEEKDIVANVGDFLSFADYITSVAQDHNL